MAITDHSASHGFGNDVQPDELRRQIEHIRSLDVPGLTVLAGTETNVLPDGSLDYDDDLLGELDWVVASLHTSFRLDEDDQTDRMLTAMEHPLVDAIGHPTGRLIGRREPYALDLDRVIEGAVRTGTFLEINANPNRRDLNDVLRAGRGRGRRDDRDRLRRPRRGHPAQHPLRRGHGAPGLADRRAGGEHPALGGARAAAQARRDAR